MSELDRRQFLVGTAGGAILLRLPPEAAGVSGAGAAGAEVGREGPGARAARQRPDRLQPPLRGHPPGRAGAGGEHGGRGRGGALGEQVRRAGGRPLRRPQLRRLLDDLGRRRDRPVAAEGRERLQRASENRPGRAADRRAARAHAPRADRAVRLVPVRRDRRAGAGRRPRARRAPLRPHERQPGRRPGGHRRRPRPARGCRHERGPLLGVPRRRRRKLRHRDLADPEDAPGHGGVVVQRVVALVAGRRGAGGLAALRARGAARAHLDLLARHHGRIGLAARGRAGAVLRRGGRAAQADQAAHARGRSEPQQRQLELLLAGPALGWLPRRGPRRLPPVHPLQLLRQVGLLRQAARPARAARS